MGLKNYKEQVAVIKQANSQVEQLKSYANSMNALIISLQSLWDDNADQGTMLNAVGDCVYEAAAIYYDYNLFSVNAIRWLNNMDNLEKLTFSMVTGNTGKIQPFRSNYTGTSITAKKNRIHVNPKDLKEFAQQVNGYNKTLDSIQVKTSGINNQIDKLILNKFASRYSLTNINRRLEKLKTHNAQVAKALNAIGEAYEATENELKKYADMMDFSAMSSGQVNGQIKKANTVTSGTKTNVQDKKTTDGSVTGGQHDNSDSAAKVNTYNADLNNADVYMKQNHEPSSCNLVANAMLIKRKAYLNGDSNWVNINKESIRGAAAVGSVSIRGSYVYDNKYSVRRDNDIFTGKDKKTVIIDFLKNHPEGVVIHGNDIPYSIPDKGWRGPHAILITDYDPNTDTFYGSDPADNTPQGRVPLSNTLFYEGIEKAERIWYIQ